MISCKVLEANSAVAKLGSKISELTYPSPIKFH